MAIEFINPVVAHDNPTDTKFKKHGVHAELLGWGILYSVNYEYRILLAENHKFTFGGGLTAFPLFDDLFFMGSLSANYLYGRKNMLEAGVSPVLGYYYSEKGIFITPRIGYRFESPTNIIIRLGASPFYLPGEGLKPWGYISIGTAFNFSW